MLHDGAEDHRLELLPLARVLGHGDEIGAEKHAADAGNTEQPLRERRSPGLFGVAQVERSTFEHSLPGQEFQGRRIWRRFGLDEHGILSRFAPFVSELTLLRGELRWKFKSGLAGPRAGLL